MVAGVLSGLYTLMLFDRRARWPARRLAGAGIVAGIVLAALADNHGPAILTGAVIGAVLMAVHWMPRSRTAQRARPGV